MLRRDRFLTLLTAVLFVLVTTSSAQQVCQQPTTTVCQQPAPVCQQPAPVCKEPTQAPPKREKPAEPVRPMIRRDLPVVYKSQQARANEAANVLDEFGESHFLLGYPGWLADKAKAIAVIPSVKKAAFIFGGRWGKGLLSTRDEKGAWLPPSYIEISGGSFGFQAGIQATDLVLVFTDDDAVKGLLRGKLTLNGTASASGGPVGRDAQAGIDILMSSPNLAFSRSKGVFVGVSLDGSVITIDDTSNQNVYGEYVTGTDILQYRRVATNDVIAPFMASLEHNTPVEGKQAKQANQASSPTN